MTNIYIILTITLIVLIVYIIYSGIKISNLEGLSVSTANVLMDMMEGNMMGNDLRLIDASKVKDEIHKLVTYGVLDESDLKVIDQCIDDVPTVFEFRRHDGEETDGDF